MSKYLEKKKNNNNNRKYLKTKTLWRLTNIIRITVRVH